MSSKLVVWDYTRSPFGVAGVGGFALQSAKHGATLVVHIAFPLPGPSTAHGPVCARAVQVQRRKWAGPRQSRSWQIINQNGFSTQKQAPKQLEHGELHQIRLNCRHAALFIGDPVSAGYPSRSLATWGMGMSGG